MDRRTFLPCLIALSLGCRARPTRALRTVRVSLVPRFALAPVYLADELGFFKEAGLELDIHQFPDSTQMIPLLAGGQLDAAFAIVSPALVNAVAKGARIRIVASREIVVPDCANEGTLYGNRRSFPQGLRDIRLLKGKRVAVTGRTNITAFFLDVLLESAGMTTRDVQLLTLRQAEASAALVGGKIDAMAYGSFDTDLEYTTADVVRGLSAADLVPNLQYSFVMFGGSLLNGDVETGALVLEAYLRGVEAFMSGRTPRAFDQLALAMRSDPSAARSACRRRLTADGRVDPSSVQRFVDWAVKKGFVPAPVDAAVLTDTRFVEEALRRLGRRRTKP